MHTPHLPQFSQPAETAPDRRAAHPEAFRGVARRQNMLPCQQFQNFAIGLLFHSFPFFVSPSPYRHFIKNSTRFDHLIIKKDLLNFFSDFFRQVD